MLTFHTHGAFFMVKSARSTDQATLYRIPSLESHGGGQTLWKRRHWTRRCKRRYPCSRQVTYAEHKLECPVWHKNKRTHCDTSQHCTLHPHALANSKKYYSPHFRRVLFNVIVGIVVAILICSFNFIKKQHFLVPSITQVHED